MLQQASRLYLPRMSTNAHNETSTENKSSHTHTHTLTHTFTYTHGAPNEEESKWERSSFPIADPMTVDAHPSPFKFYVIHLHPRRHHHHLENPIYHLRSSSPLLSPRIFTMMMHCCGDSKGIHHIHT